MGLGWFDAIAGAALPVATGFQTGRLKAEELQRQRAEDALRRQLLEAQIANYQDRSQKWEPTTMEEARDYELSIHPERTARPEGFVQPDWVKAGFSDTADGREAYLEWLGDKAEAEYPNRFRPPQQTSSSRVVEDDEAEGLAILNSTLTQPGTPGHHPEIAGPFSQAFREIRKQNPSMSPGRVSKQAMDGLRRSRPDLFGGKGGYSAAYEDLIAQAGTGAELPPEPVDPDDGSIPLAPGAPAAPSAPPPPAPGNPTGKRPVTQDQADYLRAIGRWDDALYEVR